MIQKKNLKKKKKKEIANCSVLLGRYESFDE